MADYKIWFLADPKNSPSDFSTSPVGFDFKTGMRDRANLHSKYTLENGLPIMVEYYQNYDGDATYSNIILKREDEYTFKENGDPMTRTRTFHWFDVDGNIGPHQKVEVKKYNSVTSRRAGAERRKNIIDNLIDHAELFGVQEQFEVMFRNIDRDLIAYEKTGDKTLISSIESYEVDGQGVVSDQGAWLEGNVPGTPYTIRQAIMKELTI